MRAHRRTVEIIESGRRYSWGRRDDAYYVWEKRKPGDALEHSWAANARQEFLWLEQQARLQRRRWWTRFLVGTGLVLVYATAAGIVLYVNRSPSSTPPPAQADGIVEAGRFVNPEGGFGFLAPEDWTVTSADSSTDVTSPGGTVTISIQRAPDGDIDAASEAFVEDLTAQWDDTQTEPQNARPVGDLPGLAMGGTAIDESGSPIRFLTIVTDSGERNHAISVSVPRSWDAVTYLPAIEEVLTSFKPLDVP